MKTFIFLLVPFLKRAPCFHFERKAAKGGGVLMSITIPSCNAHAYMKFSKKNFAPYAKNATVKNIITINKYSTFNFHSCNIQVFAFDIPLFISNSQVFEFDLQVQWNVHSFFAPNI